MSENRVRTKIQYTQTLGVRLDRETRGEIDIVALFHRKKPGTWARDILTEEVRKHQSRSDYNRFKKELKQIREKGRVKVEHH